MDTSGGMEGLGTRSSERINSTFMISSKRLDSMFTRPSERLDSTFTRYSETLDLIGEGCVSFFKELDTKNELCSM
jgi:hypothetical protein